MKTTKKLTNNSTGKIKQNKGQSLKEGCWGRSGVEKGSDTVTFWGDVKEGELSPTEQGFQAAGTTAAKALWLSVACQEKGHVGRDGVNKRKLVQSGGERQRRHAPRHV